MATIPTPYVFVAGVKMAATALTAGITAALSWCLTDYPRCRVWQSTNLSMPSATVTLVTWDSESYDNDTMHSTSSNTSRLVATTSGLYEIFINLQFPNATYTQMDLMARKNAAGSSSGGTAITRSGAAMNFQTSRVPQLSFKMFLAAGEYVEYWATQTGAGAGTLIGGEFSCYAEMTWVATS
jgi:hypothetical protein